MTVPADADDWDRHWDDFTSAASRNPAQEYRRRLALELLEEAGPPARVLDIGSGQGDFLAVARSRWPDAQLAGLEVSRAGVQQTRAKVPTAAVHQCDLLSGGPPPDGLERWATHALCSEVLEHVDDPVLLMRNAVPCLDAGCRVVVTVPGGAMSAFDRHIGHRRHFTPGDLAGVLGAAGLEVRWAAGAGFPFFNLYRALVIARGERLVADVASAGGAEPSAAARLAMAAFRPLFRLNRTKSRWGTQVVAVAHAP